MPEAAPGEYIATVFKGHIKNGAGQLEELPETLSCDHCGVVETYDSRVLDPIGRYFPERLDRKKGTLLLDLSRVPFLLSRKVG